MAARFWVGGSGTWSTTNTTNWSATSGGAGGASVPGAADDVTIDGNSGSPTITTNYNASVISVTINASAATLSLGGTLTCSGSITLTAGTFTTNDNNVTAATFASNNSNTRTITLGSSTVTLTGSGASTWQTTTITNLTFNGGTSTIAFSNNASSITLAGGGLTFYNVSKSAAGINELGITGANTFNNLSITGPSSAGFVPISFSNAQTINGTLSTTGTAGNQRVWFSSSTYGGGQTLTVNAASLTDADFRDIYVIGAGAPISGTRIGNRGNNRGITFSTPKSVYWNLAGSQNWWTSNAWAPSSGGTPNTDNFPLPQDTAIFDNTGAVGTVNFNVAGRYTGSVNMSARTSAMTITFNAATTCYGSWINGSGVSFSVNNTLTFEGEGTAILDCAGRTFQNRVAVQKYNGTLELASALLINSLSLTIVGGTFDTKNYNLTLGTFESENSNYRSITLGSSNISCNGSQGVLCSTSTNLTLNAGTSSFSLSSASASFSGGGLSWYDVSFTNTNANTFTINQSNTFNNLSISATASDGVRQLSIVADQTITGTLTVAGASAVRRIFVRSNTFGTTRTLTVGTLSATDCDFRDITIAGTAAGSSPTRAGDCGGNSGITFPAPKTVYWNLAGTQNWEANAWATTSGGSPAVDNFPLAQDTAVFDEAGSAGTVTLPTSFAISAVDMSARTSAMTITTSTNAPFVYGNWLFGTGVTSSSTTGTITFAGRGTSTITSNGITFGCPVTVDCHTGTVQIADALVLDSARTLTLTSGTFDAVTYNVTVGRFNSSNSNTRTVQMGSGTWTLSGTGTIWTFATGTNLNFYKGTANIIFSDTSTTARTFTGGGLSYNKLTIGGTTGTSTTVFQGANQFNELASTKTVAHTIDFGASTHTFGKWSVTGTSGNVVTLTGTGTGHILAGDATSGIDYLAMGSIGFAATSPGEFYAGANSTGTAGAPVFRTAPPAARTLYWVGGTGNWNDTARWSLSSGGAGGEATPTSLDNVIFDSASNATGYTATVNQITGGNRCKALTIAGPATGNVTLAGSVELICHDDITLPATGLTRTYTGTFTLSSSQTGRTFTTNGVGLQSDVTIDGVGCEWALGSALSSTTSAGIFRGYVRLNNGTFDTNDYSVLTPGIISQNNNSRTLNFGSSTFTVQAVAGVSGANVTGNNFTFLRGTSTFITPVGVSAGPFNHFYNYTLTTNAQSGRTNALTGDLICENNFTCTGTSLSVRRQLTSSVFNTTRTITCASATIDYTEIQDLTIAGAAAPVSATAASDMGGNSGIIFPAPKTVYRVGANTTWFGSSSWALTSGGTGSDNNFPLAQDTAVIDENTALTGTLQIQNGFNPLSGIDCSSRTTGITLNFGNINWYGTYGSITLGSGVTVSGTTTISFQNRGTTTFTSAGKTITFAITVEAPGGTFQLGDALNSSSSITLTSGTLNANNYNLTATTFASSNSNVRTITMGSDVWTLSGTGTVWDTSTSTNLTLNANTSEILLSNTTTTARTFTGGGMSFNKLTIGGATGISVLSITGFNSFSEIASTKTVAHTIRFTANQNTIGTWSVTGSSGNVVTVDSSSAATRRLMRLTNATSAIDYLNVQSIEIDAIDKFYAGANSTNVGNTLNVYFADAPTPPPPVVSGGNMFLLFM